MEAVDSISMSSAERWRIAGRRALRHSLIVWPPLAVGWVLIVGLHKHAMAFDFEHAYLPGARAVLDGHSPYPPATIAAFFPRTAFIYPPLAAYLVAPFTLVPAIVADAIVSALAVGIVVAVLWLLGVRDWRCYMISFLWVPTYSAIQTGNVTLPLALGLALLWRYRSRALVAGIVTGALVALKLFFWPLLVWLAVTRRFRSAAWAVVTAAILVVVPWAGIGFAGMRGYPHLLHVLTLAERADGYSIPAVLSNGMSWRLADAIGLVIGMAVLAAAVRARRDERGSFALVIASMLLLTPIIGMHYFFFLAVVLALYTPRFGWPWALPLLFWVGPQVKNGAPWQTAAVLVVAGVTFGIATRTRLIPYLRLTRS
jgi:alpha-1,2-mannosyltransferase